MTRDEIETVSLRYDDYDTPDQRVFALLVDVADVYLAMIEEMTVVLEASDVANPDHPTAKPFGLAVGLTAVDLALTGLAENLEMRLEGNPPRVT